MKQTALQPIFRGIKAGISIAKVHKVYPEANMVDVMLMDGSLLQKLQVVTPYASSRTGLVDLPIPEYEKSLLDKEFPLLPCNPDESDVFAVVAFIDNSLFKAIVIGFLFPEDNELLCHRENQPGNEKASQYLFKHTSNVYTRIADNGDIEISHPSGVFIKIGSSTDKTAINNFDYASRPFKWKDPKTNELAPAPYMIIQHPSGNYYTVDPEGNVTEYIVGNVTRTIKGTLTETIEGVVSRTMNDEVTEVAEGKWSKESKEKIEDTAPEIQHNE